MARTPILRWTVVAALALAGCGDNSTPPATSAAPASKTTADGGVIGAPDPQLRARAQQWPAQWCKLQPGARQSDIRAVMGAPTLSYPDQDQWEGFGVSLDAMYDADLTARQLQSNADAGALPCDDIRTIP